MSGMSVHCISCCCVNPHNLGLSTISRNCSDSQLNSVVTFLQTRPRGPADGWTPPPLRIGVRLPTPVDAPSARALADLHGRLFVRVGRVSVGFTGITISVAAPMMPPGDALCPA
jgi:hypothetical protein